MQADKSTDRARGEPFKGPKIQKVIDDRRAEHDKAQGPEQLRRYSFPKRPHLVLSKILNEKAEPRSLGMLDTLPKPGTSKQKNEPEDGCGKHATREFDSGLPTDIITGNYQIERIDGS